MSHVRPLAASLVALALLGAAAPLPAAAQLVEAKVLGRAAAGQALAAAEAEARRNGWNVSIAVVDGAGSLVAFLRMDDASPASVDLSQGKARTAARFRRPSKALEETIAGGRVAFTAVEGITPIEGGVPIVVDGKVVGAVGVSGVTSQQDAVVATAGANAVAGAAPPGR
jgi:glc operon protein GlcG